MKEAVSYTAVSGDEIWLRGLDRDESALLQRIRARAATDPDWRSFANFWTKAVAEFYDGRGVPRSESLQSPVYRVAQDLENRIGIAQGLIRRGDYRDELEHLIHSRFRTQREFCRATGLSEDMLSHVLAGRKHLSMDALEAALSRIGYRLRITPLGTEAACTEPVATA